MKLETKEDIRKDTLQYINDNKELFDKLNES